MDYFAMAIHQIQTVYQQPVSVYHSHHWNNNNGLNRC